MKFSQRVITVKSCLTLFLLFAIFGCQTTNSTITSESTVSENKSSLTEPVADTINEIVPQTGTKEEKTAATGTIATETVNTTNEKRKSKEQVEMYTRRFFGMLGGHGNALAPGVQVMDEKPSQENTLNDKGTQPNTGEERPFIELEKKLYGKWINDNKTESYDFHDDGTVIITVYGERERKHTLNGNYKLIETKRIRFDFRNDSLARHMPPRYFKISIAKDEFALTDEPKKSDEPDGPTTKYERMK